MTGAGLIFVQGAALASFLSLWWLLRGLLFGADAPGRNAGALGVGFAIVLATLAAPRIEKLAGPKRARSERTSSFGPRLFGLAPLVLLWIALPFALDNPYPLAELFPPPPGGRPLLRAALETALGFLPAAVSIALLAREWVAKLPAFLLGSAFGLFLQEIVLTPWLGWKGSALLACLALVLSALPAPSEGESQSEAMRPAPVRYALFLSWGFLAAGAYATTRIFLLPHLSSTRFSETALLGTAACGLGLGALLGFAFEIPRKEGGHRAGLAAAALLLAAGASAFLLAALSSARAAGPIAALASDGSRAAEILAATVAAGLPSLLLGFALCALMTRRSDSPPLFIGLCAGAVWAFSLLPSAWIERWFPQRPGAMVFERKATEEGTLARIRIPSEGSSARIHWNREPRSRNAAWASIEQEEILLPARIVAPGRSLLVLGTPFAAHRTAIGVSEFRSVEIVDPAPPFLEDSAAPAERDPFRFAAGSKKRYGSIVQLSSPALAAGDGLRLAENWFARLKGMLEQGGRLFVWAELRSLPVSEIETVLRSFFAAMPNGRLWIAQDRYEGPLLGLEGWAGSGAAGSPAITGPTFLAGSREEIVGSLGPGPLNTFDNPGVEWALPLSPPAWNLPSPDGLRALAGALSPELSQPSGLRFLIEALALHAEAQIPAGPFATPLERIAVSEEELQQITVGLERVRGFEPLRRHAAAVGRLLVEKKDYQKALDFVGKWGEILPDELDLLVLLGRIHHDLLDGERALPLLEMASALDPDSAEIRTLLGRVYSGLKRWSEAAASLSAADSLRPGDPQIAKELGIAYLEAGDLENARRFLEHAKALGKEGDPEIEAALERLKRE